MSEHTAGPWKYYDQEKTHCHVVFKPYVGAIASVYYTSDDIPAKPTEGEANARLIAAAPDLLRELEYIEWVDDGDEIGKFCPWCGNYEHSGHTSDCSKQAAIARATGEADDVS